MMPMHNDGIIKQTVEITTSALSNVDMTPCTENGKYVTDFMQVIYDKLIELYKAD